MKKYKEYTHENFHRDKINKDIYYKQWVKGKHYQFNNENEIIEWITNENIQDEQINAICRYDKPNEKVIWNVYCDEVNICQQ